MTRTCSVGKYSIVIMTELLDGRAKHPRARIITWSIEGGDGNKEYWFPWSFLSSRWTWLSSGSHTSRNTLSLPLNDFMEESSQAVTASRLTLKAMHFITSKHFSEVLLIPTLLAAAPLLRDDSGDQGT